MLLMLSGKSAQQTTTFLKGGAPVEGQQQASASITTKTSMKYVIIKEELQK